MTKHEQLHGTIISPALQGQCCPAMGRAIRALWCGQALNLWSHGCAESAAQLEAHLPNQQLQHRMQMSLMSWSLEGAPQTSESGLGRPFEFARVTL